MRKRVRIGSESHRPWLGICRAPGLAIGGLDAAHSAAGSGWLGKGKVGVMLSSSSKSIMGDTIAALASAVGGAVAVVRVSGPSAVAVATAAWRGKRPLSAAVPRCLTLGTVLDNDGAVIDHCLAVRFEAPASYTGEEMVEIHGHGGALSAREILLRILECGARHAEPGEFTKRAFINGKMDLTQAEAVADIINAHSTMALRLANRQLDGLLGRQVAELYQHLIFIRGEIESRLDFPDEELDWLPVPALVLRLETVREQAERLLASRREGEILRQGIRLVIAGSPNVGKSSLLNAILGRDRAIVTHIPGTTRDTLEELAHIRGIPVRLIDTAGLREAEDLVERTGIERSLATIREAQVLLWMFDASVPAADQAWPQAEHTVPIIPVGNKIDRVSALATAPPGNLGNPVYTCAVTGDGLERLFDAIERVVWATPHWQEPEIAVSARHATLLQRACQDISDAVTCIEQEQEWELAATALRSAAEAVGRINGQTAAADILDTIFARFCIGK